VGYPTRATNAGPAGCLRFLGFPGADSSSGRSHHDAFTARATSPHVRHEQPIAKAGAVLVWRLRRHYEGDTLVIDTVGIKIGRFAWSTCTATRTQRSCTWWNATGSVDYAAAKDAMDRNAKREFPRRCGLGTSTPTTGQGAATQFTVDDEGGVHDAPGRRPSPIGPPWSPGRNSSAPKTRINIMPERTPRSRKRQAGFLGGDCVCAIDGLWKEQYERFSTAGSCWRGFCGTA